jgi:arylsulfatase A-like enzyme
MHSNLSRREILKLFLLPPLAVLYSRVNSNVSKSPFIHSDATHKSPNIIFLVFDAFSAKHMSLYGYSRQTTPEFVRFANCATVYHRHYAAGNFTTPGTASLLTGTYPWTHRAMHIDGTVRDEFVRFNLFNVLGPKYLTTAFTHNPLTAILLNQYQNDIDVYKPTRELCFNSLTLADKYFLNDKNVAFWSERIIRGFGKPNKASPVIGEIDGFWKTKQRDRIDSHFEELFPRGIPSNNTDFWFFLLEDAVDWIISQMDHSPKPFFFYIHLYPPHAPYNPRREFVERFADDFSRINKQQHHFSQGHEDDYLELKRRYYDEFIAYVDAEFGRLYDFMVATERIKDTYIVVTSDHGEMFERGILGHITPTLYEPVVKVPLIIHKPGQNERKDVFTPSSCIDLLPTFAHICDIPIPSWSEGEILSPFQEIASDSRNTIYIMDAKENPKSGPIKTSTIVMIEGQYKLIQYQGYRGYDDVYELYDLINDPEELDNKYSETLSLATDMRNELISKLRAINS